MPQPTAFLSRFSYRSNAQEVVFAPGSLAGIREAVERFGWERILLITNRTLRANGLVAEVEAALGKCIVATYDQVHPHVQDVQVGEVLTLAVQHKADTLLGFGGGSPIGMAKAVSASLAAMQPALRTESANPASSPSAAVVAIPTTYSGSEMTHVYGITQIGDTPPRKMTFKDPRVAARLVVYDPELTRNLPGEMTASSGINAMAHCIEALYSITRNPLSSAAATSGLHHISNSLLRCYQQGNNMEARSEMLLGAYLAGTSLASVSMGLHHGLCHVLGGTANVPHGIANSIILPHAMRFNAEYTAAELLPAADAMGISPDSASPVTVIEDAAQQIYELIGRMNLPQRLRDVGVKETDLPHLAQLAFQNRTVQNNPQPIGDAGQIEGLLRAAW